MDNVLGIELGNCNGIRVIEMIKDGGLSFENQLKLFLLPNNDSRKCLEKSLIFVLGFYLFIYFLHKLVNIVRT